MRTLTACLAHAEVETVMNDCSATTHMWQRHETGEQKSCRHTAQLLCRRIVIYAIPLIRRRGIDEGFEFAESPMEPEFALMLDNCLSPHDVVCRRRTMLQHSSSMRLDPLLL